MNDSSESETQVPRAARWLLLIHQLPPKPDYLRVKVRRRLHRLGAVPLKQSVYVLPASEAHVEDFHWLRTEIVADGGEATICEAVLLDGVTDVEMEELFRRDRAVRYGEIVAEARAKLEAAIPRAEAWTRLEAAVVPTTDVREGEQALRRLRERFQEIVRMDAFATPERALAAEALGELEARLKRGRDGEPGDRPTEGVQPGTTWVTRRDVHVDRIASAWLIRRFIDPGARFAFAPAQGYRQAPGEVRFDMYEGEFTHEGNRCTFETLLARFQLDDPALRSIGEIVHDLDFREDAFAHPETAGVAALIEGVTAVHPSDEARLEHGGMLFDGLLAHFRRKEGGTRLP